MENNLSKINRRKALEKPKSPEKSEKPWEKRCELFFHRIL